MTGLRATPATPSANRPVEHLDVLVIGAGISGIGAGHHLQRQHPGKSYAILEARDAIGGTWDLFRYPGVRSDSDMETLGYRFRPWPNAESIADGPAILQYVRETAAEAGIDRHIRFNHRLVRAEWSTPEARWSVEVERTDTGETVEMTCGFLFSCSGYFDYEEGFTPEFEGVERFRGTIVHPQRWPEDLDYAGKRVAVIGSGATAVTLVPAMAEAAGHVTMVQRTPTYIVSVPARDPIAGWLRRILPERVAYAVTRWKNVGLMALVWGLSKRRPDFVRRMIGSGVRRHLPEGYDADTHFEPPYDPWDQRMCIVPDADLFEAIGEGRASIATDRIETFTEDGLRLASGEEIEADVIVTATGLNLLPFGGVELSVDGEEVSLPDTMAYKAMMLSGVPNFAFSVGYVNASWTLKVDLTCEYVCRLLRHMDRTGNRQATPENADPGITTSPLLDLSAGYVQRSIDRFPKAGSKQPWRLGMNYAEDVVKIRFGAIEDGVIRFSNPRPVADPRQPVPA
jgi:cation diffusion facilitator CzcD-associated flavoprotein CzcO